MTDRNALIDAFLAKTDWAGSTRAPLAGDASNRRYERLLFKDSGKTAVLMDAPPAKGEDVRPFLAIARHLTGIGLSAPHIFAEDIGAGLLIIEDLGDDLFARVVVKSPEREQTLYETAVDALVQLHAAPMPDTLAPYSPAVMAKVAALAFDWYFPGVTDMVDVDARTSFQTTLQAILDRHTNATPVLIQRDYHAENLLWLPDRAGAARVGLLDFQDAMSGHPAYDLVSLLEDARRDVPPSLQHAMKARYIAQSGMDADAFQTAYACLGAQRNLRILGVFARLSMHFGKPHYVDLIPRVWGHLLHDLDHPALSGLRDMVLATLPAPTNDVLKRLKDKCATTPML